MKNSYKYFQNKECKYFPCHGDDKQSCKYCCCPLYPLEDCGGSYKILSNGVKDCSDCYYPHNPDNYEQLNRRLADYCHELADKGHFVRK